MSITPGDIRDVAFRSVRFGWGYDVDEVDEFLDEVERRVTAGRPPLEPGEFPRFSRTRFNVRGYRMEDVDEFIDRLEYESR